MPTESGAPSLMDAILAGEKVYFNLGRFSGYVSPIDGTEITDRYEHREHMKKHDVFDVGNEAPAWLKEQQYLEKHGKEKTCRKKKIPNR